MLVEPDDLTPSEMSIESVVHAIRASGLRNPNIQEDVTVTWKVSLR